MPDTTTVAPVFDAKSMNGMYWGVIVSTALFGINIVQGWIYINTNEDKWPLRLFVAVLFGIDIAQTAISSEIIHHYLIKNFGNAAVFAEVSIPTNVEYALVVVIVFLVQLYFVGRVYMLHRNRVWIPAAIAVGATVTFVSGIASVSGIVKRGRGASTAVDTRIKIAAGIDHGFATLTDIITTIALSWTISTARPGFKRTRALLQRLLLYIVTRGLLVTIVQLVFLITYEAATNGLGWAVLHFCLGKVYIVTMITMLNSRASLRLEFDGPLEITPSVFAETDFMGRSTRSQVIYFKTMNASLTDEAAVITLKPNDTGSVLSPGGETSVAPESGASST